MVLPEPDSPTRPSVSPSRTVRLTPSTARTRPQRVWSWARRSRTSRTTPPAGRLIGGAGPCCASRAAGEASAYGKAVDAGRHASRSDLLSEPRVEPVAEPVAEQVAGEHHEQ